MTLHSGSLRILNLTGCKIITDELLKPMILSNKLLHTVDLSECHHLTAGCLQPITMQCKQLQR